MGTSRRSSKREPGHLYQREGSDVWYARVTVGGKSYRKSLETRDRREAERRLKPWLASLSPYHGTIRHSFEEASLLWLKAGRWKPKTAHGYAALLKGVILPHFGALFWDQVTKAELQRFIAKRQSEGKKGAGSKMATINRALTVISGIADHVRELDGWPEINPVRLLPVKARKPEKWNYIRPPASDIEAVFDRMKGTFGELARVLLLSGARKDELVMLHRDHAKGGQATLYDTKSGIPRTIPWSPEARALIDKQPVLARSPYVFNSKNGGHYRRATEMWAEYSRTAQMMAQRTGRTLTLMRLHDLRHEYAIRYLESGGSLYALQKLLGHQSIKQTERYLAYVTPDQAAKAMAATSHI